MPPFLKLPINSFFLVSTEMTGWAADWAAITWALMCSNCALRSGWLAPSSVLRLTCREYSSSSTSSLPMVVRAHGVAGGVERARQLLPALGDPRQWAHRIAHRCRLDKALQLAEQRAVGRRDPMAPTAGTANTAGLQRRPVEILQTTNDPRPREPGDLGQPAPHAPSRGPRLV